MFKWSKGEDLGALRKELRAGPRPLREGSCWADRKQTNGKEGANATWAWLLQKETDLPIKTGDKGREELWVLAEGKWGASSPGTQLREVMLSAPGCPSGEGKECEEQEGLKEEKKSCEGEHIGQVLYINRCLFAHESTMTSATPQPAACLSRLSTAEHSGTHL
jgi:hypothetical protein